MAQTSVEWVVEEINGQSLNNVIIDIPQETIEFANAMHKEEVMNAFNYGMNCSADYFEAWSKTTEAENYYNQNYNK